MTKPTIAELQHEFDKRLKVYSGSNEVSDLWLPSVLPFYSNTRYDHCLFDRFLAAVQSILSDDGNVENTLANNQILYPLCIRCLEKFENDSDQIHNRDFVEICLLIVSPSFTVSRLKAIYSLLLAGNVRR